MSNNAVFMILMSSKLVSFNCLFLPITAVHHHFVHYSKCLVFEELKLACTHAPAFDQNNIVQVENVHVWLNI